MSASDQFYAELPARPDLETFLENPELLEPVPDDWWVVIVDVVNSTQAVAEGCYRAVNVIGVALITAINNHTDIFTLPHTFGGDGAAVVIPARLLGAAQVILDTIRELAQSEFSLEVHAGLVPVIELRGAGKDLLVGKLRPSPRYFQSIFAGGGLQWAESRVKRRRGLGEGHPPAPGLPRAEFSGLMCPWQPITSDAGAIVNLMVAATRGSHERDFALYGEILRKIQALQDSEHVLNPISPTRLVHARDYRDFLASVVVKTASRGRLLKWLKIVMTLMMLRIMDLLTRRKLRVGRLDFGKLKLWVTEDVDYVKCDDMLRLTTALTAGQLAELQAELDELHRQGELNYGLSTSPAALLTCYVSRNEGHLGFLDGVDGGFCRAAQQYKQQLRRREAAAAGLQSTQQQRREPTPSLVSGSSQVPAMLSSAVAHSDAS